MTLAEEYRLEIKVQKQIYVYDDTAVKDFIWIKGEETTEYLIRLRRP